MAIDTSNNVAAAAAAAAPAASSADATQDRFLKLLVTQMKNQDPLNPLDNAQVTSQMAQLSTVSGIDKLNASLATVLASIAALQPIQAAGMVGKDVAVEGNAIALKGTGQAGYSLEQNADSMVVSITDGAGALVRTIDLGARRAGITTFAWDGKSDAGKVMPDGDYKFSIAATAAGKPATATALAIGHVQGVIPATDGFALNLGSLGVVPFGRVTQIL